MVSGLKADPRARPSLAPYIHSRSRVFTHQHRGETRGEAMGCTERRSFFRQASLDALSESATVEQRCHRVQSELPELSLEDELEELEDELEDELEELEGVVVEAVESLEGFLLSFPA